MAALVNGDICGYILGDVCLDIPLHTESISSGVLRLDTKANEGGRGLVSVKATIQGETASLQEYNQKMAPNDSLPSEGLRQ